jgi:hypothetical protein
LSGFPDNECIVVKGEVIFDILKITHPRKRKKKKKKRFFYVRPGNAFINILRIFRKKN